MNALGLVWAAAWRAQGVHLGIFILLPLGAALVKASLGIVLLPFLLTGEGRVDKSLGGPATDLLQPGCWVALMPCSLADEVLLELPRTESTPPRGEAGSPAEPEPFMPLPSAFTVRHAWFAAWLAWFVGYLVRRERARRAA